VTRRPTKTNSRCFLGFVYGFIERAFANQTPEQRLNTLELLRNMGGFRYWLGNYGQVLFSKEINHFIFWAEKSRTRIKDLKMRDLLASSLEDAYQNLKLR
jgi:hypothetical protein